MLTISKFDSARQIKPIWQPKQNNQNSVTQKQIQNFKYQLNQKHFKNKN